MPPGVDAPFLLTYAPGTTNREKARRITIVGPTAITGIDVDVRAADVATIGLRAAFEDGRPAADAGFSISMNGTAQESLERQARTEKCSFGSSRARGFTCSEQRRAVVYRLSCWLMLISLIDTDYRSDGCREQFNLEHRGVLETSVRGQVGIMPIRVTFPDGSPADKLQFIVSRF